MTYLEQISESTDFLISKGFVNPQIGVVLGTGLGKFLDYIKKRSVGKYF